MHVAKRYLLIALSFALCMTVLAVFTPRIAHAVADEIILVANTSANPVPVADSAVRFQANICRVSGTTAAAVGFCTATPNTFIVPTTTTTGAPVRRLMVDNVSGTCSNFNNPTVRIMGINLVAPPPPDNVANGQSAHFIPIGLPYSYVNAADNPAPFTNLPESDYTFGQVTNFAFNPGDTVTVHDPLFYPGDGPIDLVCATNIEGHFVIR